VDRAGLRRLKASEVLQRKWPHPNLPVQYYRLMDEELPLALGPSGHFYEADEYDLVSEWNA
jgi:hypothetical protein